MRAAEQSAPDERRHHNGRGRGGNPAYRPRTLTSYVLLAAGLFVLIEAFPLLSPILLSFILVIFSMLLCVVAFGVLGVLAAAPLVGVAQIPHEELYRKRFLPSVTNSDLERLARSALGEATPAAK
jgi:hypothetical protein